MDNRIIFGDTIMVYMDIDDNIDVSQVIIKLMDAKNKIIKINSYFVNNVKTNNIYVNMLPNGRGLDFDLNLFFKKKKIICHDGMMDKLFGGSYE